jgi:hypothetical protein
MGHTFFLPLSLSAWVNPTTSPHPSTHSAATIYNRKIQWGVLIRL